MAQINGKELVVEIVGDTAAGAPALVMVHGLGGTSNVWYPQIRALAGTFRIVAFDVEGAGRSSRRESGKISIESHAEDVIALMASLGIGKAHLAGHSMGTVVCQHVAAKHPDKVASLVLFGPLPEPAEAGRGPLRDRAATARSKGMLPVADATVQAATSADTKENQPVAAGFIRELVMRQDAEGYARNCEALAEARAADLKAIACPTLLVTGDEDKVGPPATAEAMARLIPQARVVVLEKCGHWTGIERPREANAAVTRFYAEHVGGSGGGNG
jgi:pimeloyl-ACP methyl ester carboxylesterase